MQNAENACSQLGFLPKLKFIQLVEAWVASKLVSYQLWENLTYLKEYEAVLSLLRIVLYWALEDGH